MSFEIEFLNSINELINNKKVYGLFTLTQINEIIKVLENKDKLNKQYDYYYLRDLYGLIDVGGIKKLIKIKMKKESKKKKINEEGDRIESSETDDSIESQTTDNNKVIYVCSVEELYV